MDGFFAEYFVNPIKYDTGYNIVNTLVYAIILAFAVFVVYKLLEKMKIKIDKKFFFAVVPFIILGGLLRSIEDMAESAGGWDPGFFVIESSSGIGRNALFITPLIYFVIFFIAAAALIISILIQKKFKAEYWKIWLCTGAFICGITISYITIKEFFALWAVAAIALAWLLSFLAIKKFAFKSFFSTENIMILTAHMFDATTTFVSIQYFPYWEQHVVAGFFINAFGPVAMFALKLPVVLIALYVIDKEVKDPQKNIFLKFAVLVLGLGPGVRNFTRLVMGV